MFFISLLTVYFFFLSNILVSRYSLSFRFPSVTLQVFIPALFRHPPWFTQFFFSVVPFSFLVLSWIWFSFFLMVFCFPSQICLLFFSSVPHFPVRLLFAFVFPCQLTNFFLLVRYLHFILSSISTHILLSYPRPAIHFSRFSILLSLSPFPFVVNSSFTPFLFKSLPVPILPYPLNILDSYFLSTAYKFFVMRNFFFYVMFLIFPICDWATFFFLFLRVPDP